MANRALLARRLIRTRMLSWLAGSRSEVMSALASLFFRLLFLSTKLMRVPLVLWMIGISSPARPVRDTWCAFVCCRARCLRPECVLPRAEAFTDVLRIGHTMDDSFFCFVIG